MDMTLSSIDESALDAKPDYNMSVNRNAMFDINKVKALPEDIIHIIKDFIGCNHLYLQSLVSFVPVTHILTQASISRLRILHTFITSYIDNAYRVEYNEVKQTYPDQKVPETDYGKLYMREMAYKYHPNPKYSKDKFIEEINNFIVEIVRVIDIVPNIIVARLIRGMRKTLILIMHIDRTIHMAL